MSPVITGRLAVGAAVLMVAAACGGSGTNSDGNSDQAGSGPANSGATVSTKAVDGMGTVLVDSSGMALYTADQETDGSVKCVNDCTDIWPPLTVSDGQTPTGDSGVTGTLGTVKRPDGSTQVTVDGKPLYRFSVDRSPGEVKGQGAKDSFGGVNFSWQVATASGQAAPAPTESSTPIYNY